MAPYPSRCVAPDFPQVVQTTGLASLGSYSVGRIYLSNPTTQLFRIALLDAHARYGACPPWAQAQLTHVTSAVRLMHDDGQGVVPDGSAALAA